MSEERINSPRPDRPAMPLPKVLIHQASESDNGNEEYDPDDREGGDLTNSNTSDAHPSSAASKVASPETGESTPTTRDAEQKSGSTDSQEVVDIKPSEPVKSDSIEVFPADGDGEPVSPVKNNDEAETVNPLATAESVDIGVEKIITDAEIKKESHQVLEQCETEVTMEGNFNESSSVSGEDKENVMSDEDREKTQLKIDAENVDMVNDQNESLIQKDETVAADSVAEEPKETEIKDNLDKVKNDLDGQNETQENPVQSGDVKQEEVTTSHDSTASQYVVEDEATTERETSTSSKPEVGDPPILLPTTESENEGIHTTEANFTETKATDKEPPANDVEKTESSTDVSQDQNEANHEDEFTDSVAIETPDKQISTDLATTSHDKEIPTADEVSPVADEDTSMAVENKPSAEKENFSDLEKGLTAPSSEEEKPDIANKTEDDKPSNAAEDEIEKESDIPLTSSTDNLAPIPRSPARSPKLVRFSSKEDSRSGTPEKRSIDPMPPINEENKTSRSSTPEKSSPIPILVHRTSENIDQETKYSLDIAIEEITNAGEVEGNTDGGLDDHQRQNDDDMMVSANEREKTENTSRMSNHSHDSEARTIVEHTMTPELQSRKSESPSALDTVASTPETEAGIGSYKPSVEEDQVSLRRQQVINENVTLRVKIQDLTDEINRLEEEKMAQAQKLNELNLRMTRLVKDDEKNVQTITKQNEEIKTLKDSIEKHQQKLERNEQQLNGNSKMIEQPVTKKSSVCVIL